MLRVVGRKWAFLNGKRTFESLLWLVLLSALQAYRLGAKHSTKFHCESRAGHSRLFCGPVASEMKVNVRLLNGGIDTVSRESWNSLVDNKHPFLLYDWLLSLEKSGCASA